MRRIIVSLCLGTLPCLGALAQADPVSNSTSYTLTTCPVSGEKLGGMGEPVIKEINGREVRFCCKGCIAKYEADPAKYEAKTDAQIVEAEKADYPMDTCVVSGEKLGGMGEPVDYVHGNRLVRFCCKGCIGKFKADPAKYLATLDAAVVEKQRASYSMTTCPVSGEELGDGAVDMVIANRLVRLCCKGCANKVAQDPAKYLAK